MLQHFSQLSSLISQLNGLNEGFNDWSIAFIFSHVENVLNGLCRKVAESDDFGDDISCNLRFLMEPFSLLFASRCQYSSDMLMFAFRLL